MYWLRLVRSEDFNSIYSPVTVRLDREVPNVEFWQTLRTGALAIAPDAEKFVRSIMDHETLGVRIEPEGNTSQTAVFDIRGARLVLEEVLSACGL